MLRAYLRRIPDPRRKQGKIYNLEGLLLLSILALLSGASSYRDIARFIRGRFEQLKAWFGLHWEHAPSASGCRKVLCRLSPSWVEEAFRAYSEQLSRIQQGDAQAPQGLALDGKALKGSFDHGKGNAMLQIVSVFCTHNLLILGHVEIPDKTNEIPVAQAMIQDLKLPEGSVYTLDAMHCQKKRSKPLPKRKAS